VSVVTEDLPSEESTTASESNSNEDAKGNESDVAWRKIVDRVQANSARITLSNHAVVERAIVVRLRAHLGVEHAMAEGLIADIRGAFQTVIASENGVLATKLR